MGRSGHTVHKSGLAADWWGGRWREDFDRAAETGQNAHRFSVEWSRIQPTPDTWDEEAIEKYRLMLRGLRERNLTALVTLHHFTDPLWVTERGGWENPEIVGLFEKFTRKVVDALKEYNTLWCTINEPNVYTMSGYVQGAFPPGKKDLKLSMRVMGNMIRAHAASYRAIHELQPEARVGYALHYRPMVPRLSWSPLDRLMRNIRYEGLNMAFPSAISTGVMRSPIGNQNIPEAKGTQDYLGLNYYSVDTVWFDLFKPGELFSNSGYPKNADMSDTNFLANIPEGIFNSIKWIERTYPNTPIIITENGVEDSDDHMRPRYLAQHLHQIWRAVNFNWPVKGYFHWSLVDNFEWERGWTQRFGLWGLDIDTQKRIRRPSVDFYAEICKENGISSDMVQKYCPEVFDKLFPS
ncbi:family 1 glycosylhydrolase [Candidatus Villigracilis affinis]|uniref:glycoside hydrolase family 1 protein n=1 Tax=Candidatus Villigracilis affinis TaxID=3140682 RepID=UPI002A1F5AB3|nr:glycoside hydrolase family 1 protein [Anaerolineales bacterium]